MTELKNKNEYQYTPGEHHNIGNGYERKWDAEIYIPFWRCKQEIHALTEVMPDEFTRIIFGLIDGGVVRHTEICNFLGISEDSFILDHLIDMAKCGFLIKNIESENNTYYELTAEGREFFEDNNTDIKKHETIDVEYYILAISQMGTGDYEDFLKNLDQPLFSDDDSTDIESDYEFSGYKSVKTRDLSIGGSYPPNCIISEKKPTLSNIDKPEFVEFYNRNHEHYFYDFCGSKRIDAIPVSIKFNLIFFEDEYLDWNIEVRHCRKTLRKFDKTRPTLESELTEYVTKYIKQNPEFIPGLRDAKKNADG
ncbi:MAG: hypothetical protein V6Z81_06975 [Parvularculales bacterium]